MAPLTSRQGAVRALVSKPTRLRQRIVRAAVSLSRVREKELPKNFQHQEVEGRLYSWWESSGFFRPEAVEGQQGGAFVVPMPPPNVTGALHMGHALGTTLQDVFTRQRRMAGIPALWLPGTDHAGIATQQVVEDELRKEGKRKQDIGREGFEEMVWDWKEQYGTRITSQLRSMGASCDWSRERFTLDDGFSKAVMEAFLALHEEGLIYRGEYMVNWSPTLQTALSDLEVEWTEEQGVLYTFNYPLSDGSSSLPVATSRPETILGDTALAVNPEDSNHAWAIGKEALVPLTNGRRVPIVADSSVSMEFGTGCLKVTPGHDPNDHAMGKRLSLETLSIMDGRGCMTEDAGDAFVGVDRFECRAQVWRRLKEEGLAIREESYTTRIPRSQRSGEIIEPMVSMQWFVAVDSLAKPALDAVKNGMINIVPSKRFERVWYDWLENLEDWCISRQLWWGHRIPVWYVHSSQEEADSKADPTSQSYVVGRNAAEALAEAKRKYGDTVGIRQEEDVLDTWFSSGLWPFITVGWTGKGSGATSQDYSTYYPATVLETGHDILFFWVARMVMMGLHFTGAVPFSTVLLHGIVRDEKGRKMSKSMGNVVDPLESIEQYGADALRFALASGTAPGNDVNISQDRLASSRHFVNKLHNVGRYVLSSLSSDCIEESDLVGCFEPPRIERLNFVERFAVSALHRTVNQANEYVLHWDTSAAAKILYDYLWDDLADWVVEASKVDIYGDNKACTVQACRTLLYCLETSLRMLHPFMPFVTEEIWQCLPIEGESIMFAKWPAGDHLEFDESAIESFDSVRALVRSIRNIRADYGVEKGKHIPCTIYCQSAQFQSVLEEALPFLPALCRVDHDNIRVEIGTADRGDEKSVQAVVQEGLEISVPLIGLADPTKEIERLEKQRAKLQGQFEKAQERLDNPRFLEKASQEAKEKARYEVKTAQEQLESVKERLEQMEKLLHNQ